MTSLTRHRRLGKKAKEYQELTGERQGSRETGVVDLCLGTSELVSGRGVPSKVPNSEEKGNIHGVDVCNVLVSI